MTLVGLGDLKVGLGDLKVGLDDFGGTWWDMVGLGDLKVGLGDLMTFVGLGGTWGLRWDLVAP